MIKISKKFNQLVSKELKKTVLPVKTDRGILVGDVLIKSQGSLKTLDRRNQTLLPNIYLNATAIHLAERIAKQGYVTSQTMEIYHADQYYGRWFDDSQLLHIFYERAANHGHWDRADILWARYSESRYRMMMAKSRVDNLLQNK